RAFSESTRLRDNRTHGRRSVPTNAVVLTEPSAQAAILEYLHRQLGEMTRATVCSRYHDVRQRLCRWLLMMQDYAHVDAIALTQEFLGQPVVRLLDARDHVRSSRFDLLEFRVGFRAALPRYGCGRSSRRPLAPDRSGMPPLTARASRRRPDDVLFGR